MSPDRTIVEIDVTKLEKKYLTHLNKVHKAFLDGIKQNGFVQADGTFAIFKGYAKKLFTSKKIVISEELFHQMFGDFVETFIEGSSNEE